MTLCIGSLRNYTSTRLQPICRQNRIRNLLGTTFKSSFCTRSTNSLTFLGGLAQNTKQYLGSTKSGSCSILYSTGSMLIPSNPGSSSFSFCWALRVVRCVLYRSWILAWGNQVNCQKDKAPGQLEIKGDSYHIIVRGRK